MPGSTPSGYPYAEPADPLVQWPATSKALAEKLETGAGWTDFQVTAAQGSELNPTQAAFRYTKANGAAIGHFTFNIGAAGMPGEKVRIRTPFTPKNDQSAVGSGVVALHTQGNGILVPVSLQFENTVWRLVSHQGLFGLAADQDLHVGDTITGSFVVEL
jgi:hypothetical protein